MEGYKSFAVTVQGGYHIKSGLVCQDSSTRYDDEGVSIAVVADGHGDPSCFRSDRGAKYAVNCVTAGIKLFVKEQEAAFKPHLMKKPTPPSRMELEKLLREKLIKQTVASWNKYIMEHYQRNPFTEQELEKVGDKYRKRYEDGKDINKAYGTTLIVAAITPWYWFGFHIGDGRFSVLYPDGLGGQPVPWDPRCYLNVTTSICDDDILDRGEEGVRTYLSLHSEEAPPIAFFLCSDGIDDNYPVEENEVYLYGLYLEIAATCAEEGFASTFGEDGASGQLKELANGFATRGKGDDTSLAGIVNIEELKKAAPEWRKNETGEAGEEEAQEAGEAGKTEGGEGSA